MARRLQLDCELSHFYGFSTFGLSREQRWALEANIPQIDAARFVKHAIENGIELTPEAWFDTTMMATGGVKVKPGDGWETWQGGDLELAEMRYQKAVERQMDREAAKNSSNR